MVVVKLCSMSDGRCNVVNQLVMVVVNLLQQEKIAKIAMDVYVMESMSYTVAAYMDSFQNPDLALESAAIKVNIPMSCILAVNFVLLHCSTCTT